MECIISGLGRLTTEHAASSHGQPILLVGSSMEAHGPGDFLELSGIPILAWQAVDRWIEWTKPEGEALELAEAFVRLGRATSEGG